MTTDVGSAEVGRRAAPLALPEAAIARLRDVEPVSALARLECFVRFYRHRDIVNDHRHSAPLRGIEGDL